VVSLVETRVAELKAVKSGVNPSIKAD